MGNMFGDLIADALEAHRRSVQIRKTAGRQRASTGAGYAGSARGTVPAS